MGRFGIGINQVQEEKSPIELFKAGTQAGIIQQVMGPVLGAELETVISQFAGAKPDLGTYAHLAGQAYVLTKILKSVEMTLEEAKEASDKVRRNGF